MNIYAIWKPSQIDAVIFLNSNDLVDKLLCVLPADTSPLRGYWLWIRMSQDDYYKLRESEPKLTVIY